MNTQMALTEEMRAKDTRSKDQLHRNKMEFEAFVQETHRKRAVRPATFAALMIYCVSMVRSVSIW